MTTVNRYETYLSQLARLQQRWMAQAAPAIAREPRIAEDILRQVEELKKVLLRSPGAAHPPDFGIAALAGLGDEAAADLGSSPYRLGGTDYDETVAKKRIQAIADLYLIYQHEQMGVFRAVGKLHQLFEAGAVRLSDGGGAFGLYRFDKRRVLRFTARERLAAYCRAFGYCAAPAPPGAQPNHEFHERFVRFIRETAKFWRDKRISETIRHNANDPTYGSVAIVRRAGLDLRENLKFASYGHLNVLRIEVLQLLDECLAILGSPDVKNLFGAATHWDVVEEVLSRYFNEVPAISVRHRLAQTGTEILRWLSETHLDEKQRTIFEGHLVGIGGLAEEWLTSTQSLGQDRRAGKVTPIRPRLVKTATGA